MSTYLIKVPNDWSYSPTRRVVRFSFTILIRSNVKVHRKSHIILKQIECKIVLYRFQNYMQQNQNHQLDVFFNNKNVQAPRVLKTELSSALQDPFYDHINCTKQAIIVQFLSDLKFKLMCNTCSCQHNAIREILTNSRLNSWIQQISW